MGLLVEHSFDIEAPIDSVWAYFSDPPQVVPCIPGAELLEVLDERTFLGRAGIRVGQISAEFNGEVQLREVDLEEKSITLVAAGNQIGAVGHAQAEIKFSLHELDPGRTKVLIVGDLAIAGKLAQSGGGMIQTVTKFIFDRFSKCVASKLKVEEAALEERTVPREGVGFLGRIMAAIRRLINTIRRWFAKS